MAAPTNLAEAFNKSLANGEPSTHGTIGTRFRSGMHGLSPRRQSLCQPGTHAALAAASRAGFTS
jgi:hypothetical protein